MDAMASARFKSRLMKESKKKGEGRQQIARVKWTKRNLRKKGD